MLAFLVRELMLPHDVLGGDGEGSGSEVTQRNWGGCGWALSDWG